ncbi:hypothetical protein CKM354_000381400 [Cercospora kikuchii]|uniref:Uncharacterized protein n=1 Tax=Cercospora kikuchii TaxID=84275 RepID=A0A9P3CCU9_9PEZI|nr:uncharacterized protein CKM354_000381400 [Cercospora kikuchii]GIZ40478.1 hypothetical protein CKM354_000381400 [Cercospora kikuchii]
MLTYLLLTLAAIAVAFAAPQTPPSGYQPLSKAISDQEFALTMRVIGEAGQPMYVALVATKNGSNEDLVLVGDHAAGLGGTPAYTYNFKPKEANGFDYVALNMDVEGTSYGLFAADVGSVYGIATTITAVKDMQQEEWLVSDSNSEVHRKLAAGNNGFYACQATVNGKQTTVLSWGVYNSNGSAPPGCANTAVSRICNVPGSTAKCPES